MSKYKIFNFDKSSETTQAFQDRLNQWLVPGISIESSKLTENNHTGNLMLELSYAHVGGGFVARESIVVNLLSYTGLETWINLIMEGLSIKHVNTVLLSKSPRAMAVLIVERETVEAEQSNNGTQEKTPKRQNKKANAKSDT